MKRLISLGAVCCALALGACSTFGGSASQDIEKSLIAAHAAYEALGVTLTTAANSGVLTGTNAATAKSIYDQAGAELAQADNDWDAGNTVGAAAQIASAGTDTAKAQGCLQTHSGPSTCSK